MLNTENFTSEFALPSKVQTGDKRKYCALSKKFRMRPPELLTRIGDAQNRQIDENYSIYPSEELIELKKQFLLEKIQQEENPRKNEFLPI